MEAGEAIVAMAFFVSTAAVFVLRGPLGRALADRIAGRGPSSPADEQIRDLAERVEEGLEGVRSRVDELEERQDFTERLLAQQRAGHDLPAGP